MSSDELERVETHLDRCPACRTHLAHLVRARTSDGAPVEKAVVLAPGATVGKYRILRVLGVGAMGVVYAAHDPQLERDIALKMLRAHAAEQRLQKEALALARLRHPNVVTVHDVGVDRDRVFIAMELVHGVTLTEWLTRTHTRAEIVAVFVQAGRGLGAAHAAGLVHRDFKPDNVLVGDDGRVCVTDFGLARAETDTVTPLEAGESEESGLLVSGSGALVGTPAYMAPEQHLGRAADARSDQFAFCVALYEALYGVRPFSGSNLAELAARVTAGSPSLPSRRLPSRLTSAVLRGLSTTAENRHASMTALLAELGESRRSRTVAVLAVCAVAAAALGVGAVWRSQNARLAPCRDAERQLATVWNPDRRASVARAFAKHGGNDQSTIAGAELDRYTARWRAIGAELCEPNEARRPNAQVRAVQRRCLERRLREVDTLARLFAEGEPSVITRAPEAVYALSGIEECADTVAASARPPRDRKVEAQLVSLENQLAEARAFEDAGRYSDGIARALPLLDEAKRLHERGAEAEVELQLGRLYFRNADFVAAERQLTDAVLAAEAGQRDELRAAALAKELLLVGVRLRRLPEAKELARRADAVVERLAGEPRLKTELLYSEAVLAGSLGDYDTSVERYRQALVSSRGADLDPTIGASISDGLGMVYYDLGKYAEGLVEVERGLQARERLFGPRHMTVSFSLNNSALLLLALDRPAEAAERARRSLSLAEATVGGQHPDVAASLQILADAEAALGDSAAAETHFRRALGIMEKTFGSESPNLTNALHGLATVEIKQRRYAEADGTLQRILRNKQQALGPRHPELASTYDALANLANRKGDPAAAIRYADLALSLRRPESDPESLASILINLGVACNHAGQTARALSSLTRANAILEPRGDASVDLAEARFALADTLWKTGERARAVTLATQAAHAWSKPTHTIEKSEAQAWLKTHHL